MNKPKVTIDGLPGEYSSIEEALSHVPKHTGNLTINISGEIKPDTIPPFTLRDLEDRITAALELATNYEDDWEESPDFCLYSTDLEIRLKELQKLLTFPIPRYDQMVHDAIPPCSVCLGKPLSNKPCVCGGEGTQEAELQGLREELANLQFQLQAHDERLLKASDPNTPWQGIHKECKGWMERALIAEQKLKCMEEYVEGYVKVRDAQKEGNND